LLSLRAEEAAATDENAQAAQDFEEARAVLLRHGDDLAAAALLPGLVAVRHLLGEPLAPRIAALDEALDHLVASPASAPADGHRVHDGARDGVRADVWAAKAAAYLAADLLDPALEAAEAALSYVDGADRIRLHTSATFGCALVLSGRGDEGWAELESAIAQAQDLDLEAEAARGYRILTSTASVIVEYDRAERWLAEGRAYAERTEQWNHRHYMTSHLAHVLWCRGRWDDAATAVREALADGEGGLTTRIIGLHVTGFLALGQGHVDQALAALREARELGEEMRELQRFSPAMWGIAECAVLTRDHATAIELTEVGYRASHEVGDAASLFPYLVTGTRARLGAQDPAAAREWATRVGADLRDRGVPGTLPAVDHAEGLLHLAAGRTGKARDSRAAARAAWRERDRWWEAQWAALDLARCAVASNRRTEASTLVGEVRVAASAVAARPLLEAGEAIGARLDRHDAPQPWSPLTLREFEVATLVARGLTNREIAEQLRLSVRTAGSHLEHISAKLGTSRRTEIAAWVTSLDLRDPTR
ncbi:MAG: LuxR C-terminal-related transcriptional regulator, partial [Nocardioides sp.]